MFRGSGIRTRPYRVDTFGKYLGVHIGPNGSALSWGAPWGQIHQASLAHQRSVFRAMPEYHCLQLAGLLRPQLCGPAVS
eukprot:1375606-Pyramimonas_sp.AAC.1